MTTNPVLSPLQFLAGARDMELSGAAFLPDPGCQRLLGMWRDTPEFAQRFDAEVSPSQAEITGSWEKSADGGKTWEHDFMVHYSRLAPR